MSNEEYIFTALIFVPALYYIYRTLFKKSSCGNCACASKNDKNDKNDKKNEKCN